MGFDTEFPEGVREYEKPPIEGYTTRLKTLAAVPPSASRACNVTGYDPTEVGVPDMNPVEASRVTPLGNVPLVKDQVNGAVPPDV